MHDLLSSSKTRYPGRATRKLGLNPTAWDECPGWKATARTEAILRKPSTGRELREARHGPRLAPTAARNLYILDHILVVLGTLEGSVLILQWAILAMQRHMTTTQMLPTSYGPSARKDQVTRFGNKHPWHMMIYITQPKPTARQMYQPFDHVSLSGLTRSVPSL